MTDQAPANTTPRVQILLAIVVAVFFVAVVIVAAKIAGDRQTYSPVSMGPVDAPKASSQQCSDIVAGLPEKAGAFKKVELSQPAPEGAGAYRNSEGTELTVRCGVIVPDQFTVLSSLSEAGGASWFEVSDATPGSSLTSWYSVGASPVVAVTSEAEVGDALTAIGESVAAHSDRAAAPKPKAYPLSDLPGVADGNQAANKNTKQVCEKFLSALPDSMEQWKRTKEKDAPKLSVTYIAEGLEPVVVRCGVAMPKDYQPGTKLTQVDDVPWFSEPGVARGSTSGRWFALGHEEIVALAMPQNAGDSVITKVSTAIMDTMKSTERN